MDILQRNGEYPLPPGTPSTLGVEFSGIVAELGEGSGKRWKVGDEVIGLAVGGAYAEYIRLFESHVMPKPKNLTWEEAASIPENFITAYQALIAIAQLKKGDDLLVHAGASGVGIAVIQLAHLFGANTITATTSSKEKIDFLLNMPSGATHGVNYRTQDFAQEVKKVTNGKGVDVIIDFVGRSHWHKNVDAFAKDGRMTILATLSGDIVENVNLSPILYKRLRIEGSTLRSRSPAYQADLISRYVPTFPLFFLPFLLFFWSSGPLTPTPVFCGYYYLGRFEKDVLSEITSCTGHGQVRTNIHQVFPMEKIQEAHRVMEADKNTGKIIVTVP
ncbi:quinone oxidoreductase [Cytidiella melzeri]|nr:quinone oxidoreductase [Cytidiella melzeri]